MFNTSTLPYQPYSVDGAYELCASHTADVCCVFQRFIVTTSHRFYRRRAGLGCLNVMPRRSVDDSLHKDTNRSRFSRISRGELNFPWRCEGECYVCWRYLVGPRDHPLSVEILRSRTWKDMGSSLSRIGHPQGALRCRQFRWA
ncbi:hypothetical protein M404DRAFT_540412 [Pisolithus tinctorius Marx 270]|uniref:Uncharacterized protein n=1 Tax=Pisolithus tinctorius Marx 270 TaxID=870435 RepID=A0A0C3J6Y3_PISTI|nr:hypothetical protein M404DRAFT_540412 [Pisolithus tinctorius Marx 270]